MTMLADEAITTILEVLGVDRLAFDPDAGLIGDVVPHPNGALINIADLPRIIESVIRVDHDNLATAVAPLMLGAMIEREFTPPSSHMLSTLSDRLRGMLGVPDTWVDYMQVANPGRTTI